MAILEKTVRSVAVTVAALFISLSIVCMTGVWWVQRGATERVQKGFGLVATAASEVHSAVERVEGLIGTSRTEVRQAAETLTAVGARAQDNPPVLNALTERLETGLAPRIAKIKQELDLARDAVGTVGNVVGFLNSLSVVAERAPRLATLDEAFDRLEGLSADTTQLRSTLRALVAEQKNAIAPEILATLNGLTQRIDTRLGEVEDNIQGVREDIAALQVRLDARKERVLFVFKLLTLMATLMLVWMIYSQIVVIRHFRRG